MFNQSCDEIYGAETTFLSKSEGDFAVLWEFSWLMGRAKHKRSTTSLQSKVVCGAFTTNNEVCQHRGMSMTKSITFIMGCGLVILRNGECNELTRHLKDCGEDCLNLMVNSL